MTNKNEMKNIEIFLTEQYPKKISINDLYKEFYGNKHVNDLNIEVKKFKNRLLDNIEKSKLSIDFEDNKMYIYKKTDTSKENKNEYFIQKILFLLLLTFILNIDFFKMLIYKTFVNNVFDSFMIITITLIYFFIFISLYIEKEYEKIELGYPFLQFASIFSFYTLFSIEFKNFFNIENYSSSTVFDPFVFILTVSTLCIFMTIIKLINNKRNWINIFFSYKNLVFYVILIIIAAFYENFKISYYASLFDKNNGYCENVGYDDKIIVDTLKVIKLTQSEGLKYYDQFSVQYIKCK